MPAPGFRDAVRRTTAVTAAIERRCLIWLAARLPRSIGSDHLTILAFLAMLAGGISFWAAGRVHRYALFGVVIALVVNWFGDSLDGTVARVRQQQRPRYGFYVDHIIDAFGSTFLLGGLALSGFMHPGIAMGLLVAYLLLQVEVYLATHCVGVFRLSFGGVGPTELRILLAIGTLALFSDPTVPVFGQRYPLFDVAGVVAIAGLAVTVVVSAVGNIRTLYREEPLPRPAAAPRAAARIVPEAGSAR